MTTLNFEGDEQSDLTVHGGVDKAVYVYPSEHYEEWRRELPEVEFPWAVFGENLTTEGLLEDVRIGDRFRIGTAEFVVTQPRLPCYKLGIRFGRMDMLKRMLRNGRTGFYFAVTTEGEVGRGRRHRADRAVGRGPDRRRRGQALHGGREEPGAAPPRDRDLPAPRELEGLLPQAALGPRRLNGRSPVPPLRGRGLSNLWIRSLPESATNRWPLLSTAMP